MTPMRDFTNRSTTREQWHAERRSRGLRAIEEQARMQYASVRRTVYPLPMPTTCDLWWQHFNVRCGHTRHRLYLYLMERRTAGAFPCWRRARTGMAG